MVSDETRKAERMIDKRAEWIKEQIDVVEGSPLMNLAHLQPRQGPRRDYRGEKLYFRQAEPKVKTNAR